MLPKLTEYIRNLLPDINTIDPERQEVLRTLSAFIREREGTPSRLTFICTHNSRRSHFGQIWGKVMAEYFGVSHVETFSGGTEATAFHPNAIEAAKSSGLEITTSGPLNNPVYQVVFDKGKSPVAAFSKVFSDPVNPQIDFCAVMTCTDADTNCPVIPGAALRVTTPYEDPKRYDGTEFEKEMYAARCRQVAIEMGYVMKHVSPQ
ncbi:protein-tyrosine-phosphatase [bacterium]|nr:protein-tyrosine-phosphatase [bacterium]